MKLMLKFNNFCFMKRFNFFVDFYYMEKNDSHQDFATFNLRGFDEALNSLDKNEH